MAEKLFIFFSTVFWWNALAFWTMQKVFDLVKMKKIGVLVEDKKIVLPILVTFCGLGTAVLSTAYVGIDPQLLIVGLFVPTAIYALVLVGKTKKGPSDD